MGDFDQMVNLGRFRNATTQGRAQPLRLRTIFIYQWFSPSGVRLTLVGLFDKSQMLYAYELPKYRSGVVF